MIPSSEASYSCLCGAVHGSGGDIKSPHLPVECGYCHCDDCRYQSGGLFCAGIILKHGPSEDLLAQCTRYNCSEALSRYFCSTCGSFCYIVKPGDIWYVGEGCVDLDLPLDSSGVDIMKLSKQYWLADTRDYKMASRLMKVGGRDIPTYARDHGPENAPVVADEVLHKSASTEKADSSSDILEARCHCGTVDLRLSRPDWRRYEAILIPPDEHKGKFHADFCACKDCRKADGGASVAPWMDVPVENLVDASSGKPVTFGLDRASILGLLEYESTKGQVIRCSCKTCGARVFFWSADKPDMCLLAPGLLRAPEGAAASNWLWWRCAVSKKEEALDREVVEALLDREALDRTQ